MNKKEVFKLAKGFRGRAKNCIRIARERVEKALQYSYRDRRNKKRDMRSLWIERINAGTRVHGESGFLTKYYTTSQKSMGFPLPEEARKGAFDLDVRPNLGIPVTISDPSLAIPKCVPSEV
ncbi:50S ribosomal protein L20 [Tanacetum coccineum]